MKYRETQKGISFGAQDDNASLRALPSAQTERFLMRVATFQRKGRLINLTPGNSTPTPYYTWQTNLRTYLSNFAGLAGAWRD